MKLKKVKIAIAAGLGIVTLSGCMGQMGVTGVVTKFNLEVVDNRYGREGMFVLLSPVYAIASAADLFIFNAIEFWSGTNPITGKSPAVVDQPVEAIFKVNDDLDSSLTEVPLSNNNDIKKATLQQLDENTLEMHVSYVDGAEKVLRGEKVDSAVNFYLGEEHITTVSLTELQNYVTVSNL
ncbi:DUF3332 domain-containing protein [Vibrio sp. JC009]|uniref:DUF3332 domain-containing protein n=1 Tax=Vibrio sp. JC009 TaxID=2912314 RepID=UPI0023B12930|nr:DUF3332 domain-containing protein [Vibrio sp. JC009]WED24460.1 DUF3332 domain-containing protein [Vibrio sp. JC009]